MILKDRINVKHKKTGLDYAITGFSKNCTNKNEGEILVLYESLTMYKDVHFSREIGEFVKKFDCPDLSEFVVKFTDLLSEYSKPE